MTRGAVFCYTIGMHKEEQQEELAPRGEIADGETTVEESSDEKDFTAAEIVAPEQIDRVPAKPRERSWSVVALFIVALLIAADYGVRWLGAEQYWPLVTTYASSFAARFLVLIISLFLVRTYFPAAKGESRIIAVLIGCCAGLVSAVTRFIETQAMWTFFNLITEPVDMIIVALAAFAGARIIARQFNKQPITKSV